MAASKGLRKHNVTVMPPGVAGDQTGGWLAWVRLSGRQMNKVSFDAVARGKSICFNSAHVYCNWTKFRQYA